VDDPKSNDPWGALVPSEVLMLIFSYLDIISLAKCLSVCRLWNSVANENKLWDDFQRNMPLFQSLQHMTQHAIKAEGGLRCLLAKTLSMQQKFQQSQENITVDVKVVMVGDEAVGKTSLLSSFVEEQFPHAYVPSVFPSCSKKAQVDGRLINLVPWDTATFEEHAPLRPLCYPETDVFLLVYNCANPASLDNIKRKWMPGTHARFLYFLFCIPHFLFWLLLHLTEVKHYCPSASLILVGQKCDLYDDKQGHPLSLAVLNWHERWRKRLVHLDGLKCLP
jgi:GTPase SAR1 family protein